MSMGSVYLRVIALLAPEKTLAILLVIANLVLAGIMLVEPWLFGHVIDSLVAQSRTAAWGYIAAWAAFGLCGIAAGVAVSLQADKMAHRRRLAVIAQFFEHAVALPLAFHGEHHTGRLLRIMHAGSGSLFGIWLGFMRDHLATLLSIVVMLPLALSINWKLALLMITLMVSFAVFNAVAMRRTDKAQLQVERMHQEMAERTGDVLSNALVVQSFTGHEDRGGQHSRADAAGAGGTVSGAARLGVAIRGHARREHLDHRGDFLVGHLAEQHRRSDGGQHRHLLGLCNDADRPAWNSSPASFRRCSFKFRR